MSFVFSEAAREEVVWFFQRLDEDTKSEVEGSSGWLQLKSLLLLTADSSVSDTSFKIKWIFSVRLKVLHFTDKFSPSESISSQNQQHR